MISYFMSIVVLSAYNTVNKRFLQEKHAIATVLIQSFTYDI